MQLVSQLRIYILIGVISSTLMCRSAETAAAVSKDDTNRTDSTFTYMPEIHGVLRARWEMATESGDSRFLLRNARVSLQGRVAPIISYFLQADLCDAGKIKMLDGWARIQASKSVFVQAGQYRMPFGTDSFRGPANYLFSNRSYIGKVMCNIRGVGVKARYTLPKTPLWVEGAVFNPTSISDQDRWNRRYAYATKASWSPGDFKVETGFMSLHPEGVRVNLTGGSLGWSDQVWSAEGEYMYKHYTHHAAKGVHAFNLWVDRRWSLPGTTFDKISVQGRFDAMTAHSKTASDGSGMLVVDYPSRSRITIGTTLGYRYKKVLADLRLDYEKCFYGHGTRADYDVGDLLSLELVVAF